MHNFPTHFWRKFQEYKEKTAIATVDDDGALVEYSFWEWTRRVQRLAIALMDANFEPGTRVGLPISASKDFLDIAFASWLVGGCLVPIAPDRSRRETLRALARSGCTWLVVEDADQWQKLRGPKGNIPNDLCWIFVDEEDLPDNRRFYALEQLDDHGRSLAVRGRVDQLARVIYELEADQPTLILFDSELGDDPHGAYFTGQKVDEMLELLGQDLRYEDDERLASAIEYGDFRAWLLTAATLMQGAQVATGSSPEALGSFLGELRPTRLVCEPAFLERRARKLRDSIEEESSEGLEANGGDSTGGLGSLLSRVGKEAARRLFFDPLGREFGDRLEATYLVGGEPSEEVTDVLDRADLTPLGLYGKPECGISHLERPGARRSGTVGRPVQGYACKIAGAKRGGSGEVLIRSGCLFDDYWDSRGPLEIDGDGWLHTGDEGHIESGYLFLE